MAYMEARFVVAHLALWGLLQLFAVILHSAVPANEQAFSDSVGRLVERAHIGQCVRDALKGPQWKGAWCHQGSGVVETSVHECAVEILFGSHFASWHR